MNTAHRTLERPTTASAPPSRRRRRWSYGLIAAAIAVTAAGVATLGGGTSPTTNAIELGLGSGESLASCMALDTAVLAQMPLAFEGTVTAVVGREVILDVTRWYKGGDATEVRLKSGGGADGVALIGGIDFEPGGQYLITASDGQVNYCGYSTVATDEMRTAFQTAFGG